MAVYLARFKGQSRLHTKSDLRGFLDWCQQRDLDPFVAAQPHLELYLRWLQEVRRIKPSTVSRRMSVVTGFSPDLASSTASSSAHQPSTSAVPRCRRSPRRSV
jgi:hypothetical protein